MTIDTWDPGQKHDRPTELSTLILRRFIEIGRQLRHGEFKHDLDVQEVRHLAGAARIDAVQWQSLASALPDEDIMDLMRFFTVAEQELPGWEAQEKSSVIGLNKLLHKRGRKLDRDFLVWIKQHSRNHFLPNGPLC